jgi:hypothetical protein
MIRKKPVNLVRCALVLIACFFCAITAASAVNIGITPGIAVFSKMLRGGYASRIITVSTSVPGSLTAHYEIYGDIEDWVRVDMNGTSFTIMGQVPYKLKVIVTPPSDAQNGNYTGFLRIVTDKLGDLTGGTGSVVRAAVTLDLKAEITGEEVLACRAGAFSIPSVEVGYPIELSYSIVNDGNVRLKPHVSLDIWDQMQENLLYTHEFFEETVPQTEELRITKTVFAQLPVGQYWANVNVVECGISELLTFNILEKGAIADNAELLEVRTKPWVSVGEIVPIIATFRNNGQRSVFASFRGKITLNDQIVNVIGTEEVQVSSGQVVNFTSFYTPKQPGKYVVSGRVYYNRKLTYEKGTVINVIPRTEKPAVVPQGLRLIPIIMYTIILIIIIILLSKIRRKRVRHRLKR